MAIEKILDLEQLEVNIYRGSVFSPDSSDEQRTFGGHIAGQALAASIRTVESNFHVHSLHGYFLRPGDATKPAVYLVERPRDGGSFCTRQVNAVQHGEVIFSVGVSFQTEQLGIEHQDAMPTAPSADSTPPFRSARKLFDDAGYSQFIEWDIRMVPRDELQPLPGRASHQQVWFKHKDPLPDDPVLHACALTYASDLTLLGSAYAIHQEERPNLMVASLDHAVWFLRPFRIDEWLLYDQSSPSATGGRSLTEGKFFNQRGDMVAAVVQEGLTRFKRGHTPLAK